MVNRAVEGFPQPFENARHLKEQFASCTLQSLTIRQKSREVLAGTTTPYQDQVHCVSAALAEVVQVTWLIFSTLPNSMTPGQRRRTSRLQLASISDEAKATTLHCSLHKPTIRAAMPSKSDTTTMRGPSVFLNSIAP